MGEPGGVRHDVAEVPCCPFFDNHPPESVGQIYFGKHNNFIDLCIEEEA
jgi:hypothetical protein